MKIILFTVLFYLLSFGLSAQTILVPYKSGEKFGLVNQAGEIVLKPQFEEMEWLTDKYFVATQHKSLTDKIETEDGKIHQRNSKVKLKSLYYKGEQIISPQSLTSYNVVPEMLVMAFSNSDPKQVSLNQNQYNKIKDKPIYFVLFDYTGKQVGAEYYQRLELIGKAGKSSRNTAISKYALFFAQDFKNNFELFVYDADERKIKERLFDSATEFRVLDKDFSTGSYFVSYVDFKNKKQQKRIDVTSDYFEIKDFEEEVNPTRMTKELMDQNNEKNPIISIESKNSSTINQNFKPFYKIEDGKLRFHKSKEESAEIPFEKEVQLLFKNPENKNQVENLIYKKGKKYSLILDGKFSDIQYDSLVYFGSENYLVCNKISEKLQCGTLVTNGKEVIPMKYSSILGQMKKYEFTKSNKDESLHLTLNSPENLESNYTISAGKNLVAYQDGKVGILKLDGSVAVPFQYDEIAENGVKLKGEKQTNFLVLKKEGLYGVIMNNFDPELKENIQQTIEPIFNTYPAYYFMDYYGENGVILFGLYDEDGKFDSYASEFGMMYKE
ncbi:MAG: WG repeat-containing protein [Weeksellaceae bacterium]